MTTDERLQEAHRLASEAARLRLDALRDAQKRELRAERDFEAATGIDLGVSDDYAVLKLGGYSFYYGYEETVPAEVDPEADDDAADWEAEWAFVVRSQGRERMRMATSALHPRKGEEPMFYLLAGIAHWLKGRRP